MFRGLLGWTFLSAVLKRIVRIVNGKKEESFSELLKIEAQEIASQREREGDSNSLANGVRREIALVLNHLDRQRTLNTDLLSRLKNEELYFHTKLAQLWPGREQHVPYLWREQDKVKLKEKERWQDKLLDLEHERRKLSLSLEEKVQPLEDRLLSLLQRHAQLKLNGHVENGHRKNSEKA